MMQRSVNRTDGSARTIDPGRPRVLNLLLVQSCVESATIRW